MPKRDNDLFTRLRRAGVRKPVAKTLSELTEDAGKKAAGAGHSAVAELRSLAEEIEKRLPALPSLTKADKQPEPVSTGQRRATPASTRKTRATPASTRKPRATPASTRKAPATSTSTRKTRATPASTRTASAPRRRTAAGPAASAASTSSTAPRGENKAKILAALKTGPQTASEVSQATGIPTATVSAALTRLSKAGEVTKATRGYALPS